jgi:hypothetical protein
MGKAPTLTKQARANRSQSAAPRNSSVACMCFSHLPGHVLILTFLLFLIGPPCKASKIRCDRGLPCSSCVKKGLEAECSGDKDGDEPLNTATEEAEETVEPHSAVDDELAFLRAEGEPFFDVRIEIPSSKPIVLLLCSSLSSSQASGRPRCCPSRKDQLYQLRIPSNSFSLLASSSQFFSYHLERLSQLQL